MPTRESTSPLRTLAVAALLVVAALCGGVQAATPTGGATVGSSTVGSAATDAAGAGVAAPSAAVPDTASGSASFADHTVHVTRGDVLNVTVSHSDTAQVNLGGNGVGYHLRVTLDGSGTDTIQIDTYHASDPVDSYVTGGDPTLLSRPLHAPLAPAKYVLNVTVGGVERDLGTVVVDPRGPMNASTYVAPGSIDLSSIGPSELRGALTARSTVARGDVAVIRLNESGLETAFNASDLSGDAAADGIAVRFTAADPRPNHPSVSFTPTASNVTVFPQFQRDEVLLAWNTSGVALRHGNRTFDVNVTLLGATNGLVERNRTVANATVTVEKPAVALSATPGFRLLPDRSPNLTVSGETNLAPGRKLDVRARSSGSQTFLRTHLVTVDGNGSFAANFDFGGVRRGASFPLWVLHHRPDTEHTVSLPSARAALDFADQSSDGTRVTVRSADLPAGGFVVLRGDAERLLGVSKYLPPGVHRNVTVPLDPALTRDRTLAATAYLDSDANRTFSSSADRPYAPDNATVTATANVSLPTTATPTPASGTPAGTGRTTVSNTTTPPTATPTPTPYPVVSASPLEPTTQSNGDLSPLVALVALLAAGLLVGRRHA